MTFIKQPRKLLAAALSFYLFAASFYTLSPAHALSAAPFDSSSSFESDASFKASNRPPRTFDAISYTLRTRFDANNKTVTGDETITLKPLAQNFDTLTLDASDMEFQAVTLANSNVQLQWSQAPDKLNVKLDRSYNPEEEIAVRIQYRAKPRRGLYFIRAEHRSDGRLKRPAQIWTQGEPEDNHHWFPCYDFPDDKATSEQYITTGADEIAISNGALVETTNNPDGTRTFHWKMDQPHATYLISLVVGNYVKLTDSYKNIPIEYYTYPGTEAVARLAFGHTPKMMDWFSRRLNYEYPYNKYAQTIVSHSIFGGMENITATTQSDVEILHRGDGGREEESDNLVSHELAHSWFGDLVTCKTWAHLWLNEGAATFMEASFQEHLHGQDGYLSMMREDAQDYFQDDSGRRRPVVYDEYSSINDLFNATIYKKGAYVLHMLRALVGEELFWKSLNKYLTDYKYQNVETADLQRVFEETTGRKLDWFFDQWVYKAGYPELRVRSSYDAAAQTLTLDVSQTQKTDDQTPAVFRLPLAIEIATEHGKQTEQIEIKERTQRFTFQVAQRPLMIQFDKGARVLKKLDFPQSKEAWSYQLLHSTDVIGRTEAVEALAQIVDAGDNSAGNLQSGKIASSASRREDARAESKMMKALLRASRNDSSQLVRGMAREVLAHLSAKRAGELRLVLQPARLSVKLRTSTRLSKKPISELPSTSGSAIAFAR